MTSALSLPALNGTNPLGFFAALGVLDVLTRANPIEPPTLRWDGELTPTPMVGGHADTDELVRLILVDRERWVDSVVLNGHGDALADDIKPDPGSLLMTKLTIF